MKLDIDVKAENIHKTFTDYKMIIPISGDMNIEKTLSESDLNDLLDRISVVLGYKEIMQKFDCTIKDARDIKKNLSAVMIVVNVI